MITVLILTLRYSRLNSKQVSDLISRAFKEIDPERFLLISERVSQIEQNSMDNYAIRTLKKEAQALEDATSLWTEEKKSIYSDAFKDRNKKIEELNEAIEKLSQK